jgi:hypothetical protein
MTEVVKIAGFIRSWLPLALGLVIGGLGGALFHQSMPGAEGSPEERAARMEVDLKKAQNRIAALEAADPRGRRKPGRTFADGARNIADDIREGRPVSPDDLLRASQPLLRDLAPLFDRMRVRAEKQVIDRMTGELARKHDLTNEQRELLRSWFEAKSEANAKAWSDLVAADGTTLEDLMIATRDVRPDDGIDEFMPRLLTGEKLAAFQAERMAGKAARVQNEADARTQRLDDIVGLDDAQRDQVFGIIARGSRDYDPAMALEGAAGGNIAASPAGTGREAVLSVLRPDQRAAYEAERQRRREQAAKDMEAIGLTLPEGWDMLDAESF